MESTLQKQVSSYIKWEISLVVLLEGNPNFWEIHKILLYIYKNTKFVAKEKMFNNFVALESYLISDWEKYNRIITIHDNYYKFKNQYLKKNTVVKKWNK